MGEDTYSISTDHMTSIVWGLDLVRSVTAGGMRASVYQEAFMAILNSFNKFVIPVTVPLSVYSNLYFHKKNHIFFIIIDNATEG